MLRTSMCFSAVKSWSFEHYLSELFLLCAIKQDMTRNIFKKDIRRLSKTDNFNTTKWRKSPYTPCLCMLEKDVPSKNQRIWKLWLCFWSLFCLVLFSLSDMHLNLSKYIIPNRFCVGLTPMTFLFPVAPRHSRGRGINACRLKNWSTSSL